MCIFPLQRPTWLRRRGHVVGFYSLYENTLAAILCNPTSRGHGLGSALLEDAKRRREWLQLTVYAQNASSVRFYETRGFVPMGEQLDEHTGERELLIAFQTAPRHSATR